MARRARGLTQADRALWRAYAVNVTPLPGRDLPSEAAPPASSPLPAAPVSAGAPVPPPRPARAPEIAVGTQPAGLDTRRWTALRRGRLRPERTLDLHGRRAQDAHAAVRAFLLQARVDGLRCVAVVTGKGSSPEGGILRRELPHWLNAPDLQPLILGAAHPHAANSGAVHLLLRRPR
ncbi:MAG TPA: Smr/MutS family protein [Acetobacteraceae bacterium]|nr:Smr/MutS family protein [Acetobacteraceae bacterium]